MSEDSNQPTPPPSPEERPVQPEAESFNGGLEGDSWLLDVGPEPGTEYEEHESVPALPLDWDEGAPNAGWDQGGEAPEAPPAFAEGFDVFEESEVYGAAPEGFEDFGDGGETSFVEPAPRSRPMVEAILPGVLAMLLSFAGIAVWSFLRTPASFNDNFELARSEHEVLFAPDEVVELAKPLQLSTPGPSDDRVAGWMEIGQTADDLSEPDELGYASSLAEEEPSYASVPSGPEPVVVSVMDAVEPEPEEGAPEVQPSIATVLEALGAAEPVGAEPNELEAVAVEPTISEIAVEDPAANDGSIVEPETPEVAAAEAEEPAPVAVAPEAADVGAPVEPEAVAAIEPVDAPSEEPADQPRSEPAVEVAAGNDAPQPLGAAAGGAVAVAEEQIDASAEDNLTVGGAEVVADVAPSAAPDTAELAEVRPFQGPGPVPAPMERLSDGVVDEVALANEPEGQDADATDTETELEPGAFASGWLMALVAPAPPGADVALDQAPSVAQLSLPEAEVDAVIEDPVAAAEDFDWTAGWWNPEASMSPVELPESFDAEPYEPRVVEIEVFDPAEGEVEVAAAEVVTEDASPLQLEDPAAAETTTEAPTVETLGVAALGWPSSWPNPWESEAVVTEPALESIQEPMPVERVEVAEATEPEPTEEIAAAELPAVAEESRVEDEAVAAIEAEENPAGEPAFEEIALVETITELPVSEEPAELHSVGQEQILEEPVLEVAASEAAPMPESGEEPSMEAASLTAIGWPSDWPMAWDDQPTEVTDPAVVAAAGGPEETPVEFDEVEPAPEPEVLAEVSTETEPAPVELAGVESDAMETSDALVLESEVQLEAEQETQLEPAMPTNEVAETVTVAAASEPTDEPTEEPDDLSTGVATPDGEVALEVDAPVEEASAEDLVAAAEPDVEELDAGEAAPEVPGEQDDEVVLAASSDGASDEVEVAVMGPALPEFAPVLVPPSPDLVSDLHADADGGNDSMDPAGALAAPEVVASIPAAPEVGSVQAEFEAVSSDGSIVQEEVAVEVVGSIAEEAPTRRRRQMLERIEDERYWRFKSVPSRKFNDDSMIFTPNVGNVRVVLKGGEAFDGRLHSVGQGKIMLDTKMGRMAVDARRADRVDRITDDRSTLRGPATTTSTAGLKRVKVKTDGGVFYGHLVSREGKRVTILMDEGFRITLESDDVTEAADRRSGRLRRVGSR